MSSAKVAVSVVNENGQGVFQDEPLLEVKELAGPAELRRIYSVPEVPVLGVKYASAHEAGGIANKAGVEFLQLEMGPGAKSPMHATPSVDFGVMVSGELTLILDSGEERVLKPGDVYVQKSANHMWENRGTVPAVLTTVVLASRP